MAMSCDVVSCIICITGYFSVIITVMKIHKFTYFSYIAIIISVHGIMFINNDIVNKDM